MIDLSNVCTGELSSRRSICSKAKITPAGGDKTRMKCNGVIQPEHRYPFWNYMGEAPC